MFPLLGVRRPVYLLLIPLWLLGLSALFAYLLTDYTVLSAWYRSLGPLYREAHWTTDFFTPATKATGNWLVSGGVGLLLLMPLGIKALGRLPARKHPTIRPIDWAPLGSLLALLTVALVVGNSHLATAYDEAFSAVRVAGRHPFHTWSYYMLPNNHVLFNLVNGMLFGWYGDLVRTGRLLAGGALLTLATGLFIFLRPIVRNPWYRALIILVAMLQFPVWAFGVQARGYLPLLLGSWTATVGLYGWLQRGERQYLWAYVVGSVGAFATVPVFLYVAPALVLYWVLHQWRARRWDRGFLPANFLVGALTFLFYLPTLAFSGLGAVVGNRYVDPTGTLTELLPRLLNTLGFFASYPLGGPAAVPAWLAVPLSLLPALYFLRKSRPARLRYLAQVYLLTLCTTIGIILLMRVSPFNRVIIFQTHLAWVLLLSCIWYLAKPISSKLGAAALVLVLAWTALPAPGRFSFNVYYYSVNSTNDQVREIAGHIPAGASIRYTEEAFLPEYLLAPRTAAGDAALGSYLIRSENDKAFVAPQGATLEATVGEYELYRLRE